MGWGAGASRGSRPPAPAAPASPGASAAADGATHAGAPHTPDEAQGRASDGVGGALGGLAWPARLVAAGLSILLLSGASGPVPGAAVGALRGATPVVGAALVAVDGQPARVAAPSGPAASARAGGPAPAVAQARSGLLAATEKNAQVPGSAALARPAAPLEALKQQGYWVRPVASLDVLNTLAPSGADAALERQKVGAGGYDAVVNGGFYFQSGGRLHAAGPVVRDGKLEAGGVPKSAYRGALAVRSDGAILIGRQDGASLAALEARFGPLRALMGGGALLIEDGAKVSSADLGESAGSGGQQFDQGARGLGAQQMRRTYHTVLGVRDGQLYLVGAASKSGAEIRDQLHDAGFDAALKLDGGSGGYYREAGDTRVAGLAPLGFGVRFRR